ncbi:MAG: hypothetical protein HXN70_03915 [Prevotella pallens]|jgi:hypothetical protein|uniref:hypothetical protein n=1 Tax=Prevotella pallens TaxID=60133 RepID=UPI001CAFBB12|nr:hypothetical protein [Prevotella pallens]MBF1450987.1 hypothetical protein [Prevotella pallens]MBF1474609.1 hypothetical protein [Prevotella pallens]
MMKKYIKPNVVSVATISEGCLLAGTGGASSGGFSNGGSGSGSGSGTGHAKVSNFDETELEFDQKEHTEN